MSRDIKRNPYQWTKKQLTKKFEIFKKYEGTKYDPINKPYNQRLIQELEEKKDEQSEENE